MPKLPDDDDDYRAGRGSSDPEADVEDVPGRTGPSAPKPPSPMAAVAALPWIPAAPDWLTIEPEARRYLLHDAPGEGSADTRGPGILPRGKVGILAAAGGVGKTYALCGLALALATYRPWLGHFPVGPDLAGGVVLVLGEEDALEVRRRLWNQARAMALDHELDRERVSRILALPGAGLATLALTRGEADPLAGADPATDFARGLFDFLAEEAGRRGRGWDAVIFDPLARFAGPDVEKDNAAATRLIQVMERFAQLPGDPAVIVAHHTSKASRVEGDSGATAARGVSGLTDGARWAGGLDPDPIPGFARFRVTKSNYAAFPRSYGSGGLLLVKGEGGGIRAATAAEHKRHREAVLEAEKKAGAEKAERAAAHREGAGSKTPASGSKARTGDPDA